MMDEKNAKLLGIFLFLIGILGVAYTSNLHDVVLSGTSTLSATFTGYPMSIKSAEDKISPMLKDEISKVSPEEELPVVVVLTAPKQLAAAQQQSVMQTLQAAGFRMTLSIVDVTNAIAGTVKAKNIGLIASNPNVDEVLYDGKFFKLSEINVNLLSESAKQIHADAAWAEGYTGQGVTVVVIDSGIQNTHPFLMRNGKSLVIEEHPIVPGAVDYTTDHGTHVAGIIASQDSKYRGVAPGIKGFVDIIAFDSSGSAQLSWILAALDEAYRAAKNNYPAVCTNSWGAPAANSPELNKVREAVMKLTEVAPVVFAAGNTGPSSGTINCPGDADENGNEVITVGAVDKSNNIAWFSSRGPDTYGTDHNEPDIVAPGVSITSAVPGGVRSMSGTSMATPHVAGVVALMLSKNPGLTNKQCLDILMKSAQDLGPSGFDYQYGAGLVRADRAIDLVPGSNPVAYVRSSSYGYMFQIAFASMSLIGLVLIVSPSVINPR